MKSARKLELVDFLIGDQTAIEVKSARKVSERDLKGLRLLEEEGRFNNFILVSQDSQEAEYGKMKVMHYSNFLDALWAGRLD